MFYLHLSWWDFTSPMRWKMNPEFYEILSHLTASSVASKHPQELLNPQETLLPLITTPKDLYYTINHPFQRDAAQAVCYSCNSRTFRYPETLFLCYLPFQASLSQPFHQLFHHRFCINPAASYKQAGSWLRKKQSSEKGDRTRTTQELWKSVFTKPTNMIHEIFIISSE